MPKPVKTLDNMTKNLTKAERTLREQAETAVMPTRTAVNLKPPSYVRSDKTASKYWCDIIKRMDGIDLLDDLDTEILGVYCAMLSRRDATQILLDKLLTEPEGGSATETDALMSKLQALERSILQYADKLGLTPSGRVHLARKRANSGAELSGEEVSLFGGD